MIVGIETVITQNRDEQHRQRQQHRMVRKKKKKKKKKMILLLLLLLLIQANSQDTFPFPHVTDRSTITDVKQCVYTETLVSIKQCRESVYHKAGLANFNPQEGHKIRKDSPESLMCLLTCRKERLVYCMLS
jgi:hypothetical protein